MSASRNTNQKTLSVKAELAEAANNNESNASIAWGNECVDLSYVQRNVKNELLAEEVGSAVSTRSASPDTSAASSSESVINLDELEDHIQQWMQEDGQLAEEEDVLLLGEFHHQSQPNSVATIDHKPFLSTEETLNALVANPRGIPDRILKACKNGNSYILFSVFQRAAILQSLLPKASFKDIARETARRWKALPPTEKKVYMWHAKEIKQMAAPDSAQLSPGQLRLFCCMWSNCIFECISEQGLLQHISVSHFPNLTSLFCLWKPCNRWPNKPFKTVSNLMKHIAMKHNSGVVVLAKEWSFSRAYFVYIPPGEQHTLGPDTKIISSSSSNRTGAGDGLFINHPHGKVPSPQFACVQPILYDAAVAHLRAQNDKVVDKMGEGATTSAQSQQALNGTRQQQSVDGFLEGYSRLVSQHQQLMGGWQATSSKGQQPHQQPHGNAVARMSPQGTFDGPNSHQPQQQPPTIANHDNNNNSYASSTRKSPLNGLVNSQMCNIQYQQQFDINNCGVGMLPRVHGMHTDQHQQLISNSHTDQHQQLISNNHTDQHQQLISNNHADQHQQLISNNHTDQHQQLISNNHTDQHQQLISNNNGTDILYRQNTDRLTSSNCGVGLLPQAYRPNTDQQQQQDQLISNNCGVRLLPQAFRPNIDQQQHNYGTAMLTHCQGYDAVQQHQQSMKNRNFFIGIADQGRSDQGRFSDSSFPQQQRISYNNNKMAASAVHLHQDNCSFQQQQKQSLPTSIGGTEIMPQQRHIRSTLNSTSSNCATGIISANAYSESINGQQQLSISRSNNSNGTGPLLQPANSAQNQCHQQRLNDTNNCGIQLLSHHQQANSIPTQQQQQQMANINSASANLLSTADGRPVESLRQQPQQKMMDTNNNVGTMPQQASSSGGQPDQLVLRRNNSQERHPPLKLRVVNISGFTIHIPASAQLVVLPPGTLSADQTQQIVIDNRKKGPAAMADSVPQNGTTQPQQPLLPSAADQSQTSPPVLLSDHFLPSSSSSSSPLVTPSSPLVTPSSPLVTPSSPLVTPSSPLVTPSSPLVTPSSPLVTRPSTPISPPLATSLTAADECGQLHALNNEEEKMMEQTIGDSFDGICATSVADQNLPSSEKISSAAAPPTTVDDEVSANSMRVEENASATMQCSAAAFNDSSSHAKDGRTNDISDHSSAAESIDTDQDNTKECCQSLLSYIDLDQLNSKLICSLANLPVPPDDSPQNRRRKYGKK